MKRRRCFAPFTLALTVAALTACSTAEHDHGEDYDHGTGVPPGATIAALPPLPTPWNTLDRNDAQAVALAAVHAVFDWHPERGETGPEIAARRAAPLFTPRAVDEYRPYTIPRPTWQGWMDDHATITATTTIGAEEHPADTAAQWQRKVSTALTITTDGKPTTTLTVISLITAQKQPVWTITQLTHLQ